MFVQQIVEMESSWILNNVMMEMTLTLTTVQTHATGTVETVWLMTLKNAIVQQIQDVIQKHVCLKSLCVEMVRERKGRDVMME